MSATRSFGRRAGSQSAPMPKAIAVEQPLALPIHAALEEPTALRMVTAGDTSTIDHELEDWKKSRSFQIPWRPLSWMASLSFGIASFVLPDTVNDNVEWLLYALMAASFLAGFAKRRKKAGT